MPERDSTADLKAIKDRVEWRRTMGGRSSDVHPTLLEMEEGRAQAMTSLSLSRREAHDFADALGLTKPTIVVTDTVTRMYGGCACPSIYADGGGCTCGYCWEHWPTLPLTAMTWPG